MDTREIGYRVGKSPAYVAQRTKLNELIQEIQQFLYDGHLLIKDALVIAGMKADDQLEFFNQKLRLIVLSLEIFTK